MIVIVNYGMGNLGSLYNMLKKIGADAKISSDPEEIMKADKLLLPGVGAFAKGMKNLQELELIPVLKKKVLEQATPILGICLGMQLLATHSEEGNKKGLSWIDAYVRKFSFEGKKHRLKVPHMGWNFLKAHNNETLFRGLTSESRFYFVHSYYLDPSNTCITIAKSDYGIEFTSAIQHKNIYGVQFHPEKSLKFGMNVFHNFVEHC